MLAFKGGGAGVDVLGRKMGGRWEGKEKGGMGDNRRGKKVH